MTTNQTAADITMQIKVLLVTHGINQGELARRMGLGQPAVSMMLARGTYTLTTLVAVANAFGVGLTVWLGSPRDVAAQ